MIYGTVHSVFDKAFNVVTTDNCFLSLISASIPPVPASITLDVPKGQCMHTLGVARGMAATFFPDGIWIGRQFPINLVEAKEWDPRPILDFDRVDEMSLATNIQLVRDILLQRGNRNGIAPMVLFCDDLPSSAISRGGDAVLIHAARMVVPGIRRLIDCILSHDVEGCRHAAHDLIGFGPGLTPSADDFLCGLMGSLLYSAAYYGRQLSGVYEVNQAIIAGAPGRTTRISAEMLRFAATGRVAESVRGLLLSIFSKHPTCSLADSIVPVLGLGATSGSDLAAGIYQGCKLGACLRIHETTDKLLYSMV